jgi:hypothetical protein
MFFHFSFMLWYVGMFLTSYFLPFIYNIWFSDAEDNQIVTDPLLQNTHVDSNARQSSGMAFYTSLRVLTFTEQNNK